MCAHDSKIGDNYGLSCQDCGERLEGFGFGGWFGSNLNGTEVCIHVWGNINDIEEACQYCETVRERKHKVN